MTARRAIIAGGGIGGLTAALCLARAGLGVTVLEQAAAFSEVGAGIQLSPNATRVMSRIGVLPALERVAFRPEATEMRHWREGHVIARTELGDAVCETYGVPYLHLHRADLIRTLAEAAERETAIGLQPGRRVTEIGQSDAGVWVEAGGQCLQADLLVGADGIHSVVRSHLFGPEAPQFTGNIAWRGLVRRRDLPDGLVRPVTTAWWGPGRHFVHYYVRGGDLVNCVCVVEKTGWERESWTERGDIAELRADFDGWHPAVQTLIDAMDPDQVYKWALFDRPPMALWHRGRATLLGDACHPTLPFMAQGAAMAIEDAATLAACLDAEDRQEVALARYESLRRPRASAVQEGSRRNARLFHLSDAEAGERNRNAARARGRTLNGLFRHDAFDIG